MAGESQRLLGAGACDVLLASLLEAEQLSREAGPLQDLGAPASQPALASGDGVRADQLDEQAIDDAAVGVGRSPADVRRLFYINGSFTGSGFLHGPPAVWTEQLAGLAMDEGISGFVLATDIGDRRDLHRFAEEVVSAVRELVERERTLPAVGEGRGQVPPGSAAKGRARGRGRGRGRGRSLRIGRRGARATGTTSSPSTTTCARSSRRSTTWSARWRAGWSTSGRPGR